MGQPKRRSHCLEQLWEQGVTHASEMTSREQELGAMLNEAAGLQVKSGVPAGANWSNSCGRTCGCPIASAGASLCG